MDRETWVAFKIALVLAIVVGFGLYQFNLKYKLESDITNRAILGSQSLYPRAWATLRLTEAGVDSFAYFQTKACSLYATQDTVYTSDEWKVDISKIKGSVSSSKLNYK